MRVFPEQAGGQHRGLGAALQAQLRQHAGDIILYRLLGQEHPAGDLPIGQPFGHVLKDPPFLIRQTRELARLLDTVADPFQDPLGDRGVEERLPAGDPAVTQRVLERIRNGVEQPRELASLTEQERRILEYVAEGLTNREIAGRMFLAEKTVKNYVSSLLAKLGLERRTQAAVLATRLLGEHPHG